MTARHRASSASTERGRHRAQQVSGRGARGGVATAITLVFLIAVVVVVGPAIVEALPGSSGPVQPPPAPTRVTENGPTRTHPTKIDAASGLPTPSDPTPDGSSRHPPRQSIGSQTTAAVPESGPGTFAIAARPGWAARPTGTGNLVTYTVELERGLPFNMNGLARVVDRTLADPRGWTAKANRSVRRVTSRPDLRILVATPETTDALCAPLKTGGRLSCRNGNLVVLNAWRWANGADAYRSVAQYRRYLVNHEFGHALGNKHQSCEEPGGLASVMVQQTKGLQGCRANPWPFP